MGSDMCEVAEMKQMMEALHDYSGKEEGGYGNEDSYNGF